MSMVLVIPDVHLKPWMFDRAEKILESAQADFAVQLGDLVDNWGALLVPELYVLTMSRAISFHLKFTNTLWCMGNHDYGYYDTEWGRRESGHSVMAEKEMPALLERMRKIRMEQKIVHKVDNVLFSHAGLTEDFARLRSPSARNVSSVLEAVNSSEAEDLWREGISPIWARPQEDYDPETGEPHCGYHIKMRKSDGFAQVVGHTPMRKVVQFDNFLSTDVFSTYSDGSSFGEERFAIVDTAKKTWEYAKEEK